MKTWVKIDRANGNVLKHRKALTLERVFNKKYCWIELVTQDGPSYDSQTHKLEKQITQSDFSNLTIDVSPTAVRTVSFNSVALSSGELKANTNQKIISTDQHMARMVEDILVKIATDIPLTRDVFHTEVWTRINARRALRGEGGI